MSIGEPTTFLAWIIIVTVVVFLTGGRIQRDHRRRVDDLLAEARHHLAQTEALQRHLKSIDSADSDTISTYEPFKIVDYKPKPRGLRRVKHILRELS